MTTNTKTALLDAAETAVRTRGYDGFSYADLATAVGIRKASIHHHFPTKATLSAQVMQRYHDRMLTTCTDITATNRPASEQLRAFMMVYRNASQDGSQLCLCVAFLMSQTHLPPDLASQTQNFHTAITPWLETVFQLAVQDGTVLNAQPSAREAPALLALLEGAQLAARAQQDISAFDDAIALFQSRLG